MPVKVRRSTPVPGLYHPQDIAAECPVAAVDAVRIATRPVPRSLAEPKLVAEIKYLTWTADGLLRHTVYVGLREDKPAAQVRRER
jgi:ATP-dependent DNA ligase